MTHHFSRNRLRPLIIFCSDKHIGLVDSQRGGEEGSRSNAKRIESVKRCHPYHQWDFFAWPQYRGLCTVSLRDFNEFSEQF
jgi:hypothetical protein